jgi:hypothetical protein
MQVGSTRVKAVIALALLTLAASLIGAVAAQATTVGGTLTVPLPEPTGYSVTILDRTLYSPTLNDGQVSLTGTATGDPLTPELETTGFACPTSTPNPVLKGSVSGGSGALSGGGSVSFVTNDPRTGAPQSIAVTTPPVSVPLSAPPVQLLTICST